MTVNTEHFVFQGYTAGLLREHARVPRPCLVKAEISYRAGGVYDGEALPARYRIKAVSGHSLGHVAGAVVYLSPEEYEALPSDPYDTAKRATALLARLGWHSCD